MKNPWRKLSSKIVHKNPWYYVRQDKVIRPDGSKGLYNVLVSPPSVFIVAMNSEKEIILLGQYRYPTGLYSLEIPGGGSDGQNPLAAAKREFQEETGFIAKRWKQLGRFTPANGFMSEISYAFLATKLSKTSKNKQLEEGIQEVIAAPFAKVFQLIKSGQITDGQSIIALTMAALRLGFYKDKL